jgi:hypothetical protein
MAQTVNFNDSTPATAANGANVKWQNDSSNPPNISAYMPSGVGGASNIVAKSVLTAQGAAIVATTLFAVPSAGAGLYRVSFVATVTRAATTSSVLGGANGFQVVFVNGNGDSVTKTSPIPGAPSNGANQAYSQLNNGNTTASMISGTILCYSAASQNIQFKFDYTSVGGTTMQYDLASFVEFLGS